MKHLFETVTRRQIQHIKYKTTLRQPPVSVMGFSNFPGSESRRGGTGVGPGLAPALFLFLFVQTGLNFFSSTFELLHSGLDEWVTNLTQRLLNYKKHVFLASG